MAIGTNKEYRMAVALLQFKHAYKELVAASKDMPDLDLSEMYPFYLLDFEQLDTSVQAWCSVHASKLMRYLPDRVDNPACLSCHMFRAGLDAGGMCKGVQEVGCTIHPMILYTREAVAPVLLSRGYSLNDLDDTAVQLLFMKECESIASKKK